MKQACHLCGSKDVDEVVPNFDVRFVTSDARPWPGRARLLVCNTCGTIQKATDALWQREVEEVYLSYNIYQQSGGAEQRSFHEKGLSQARSKVILQKLFESLKMPDAGRLLDLGCGNGSLLASMQSVAPDWHLYGTEFDAKNRQRIEGLAGVRGFHAGDMRDLPWTSFDVITLIHLIEHIPDPASFLRTAATRLCSSGVICIECPNIEANPFDLVIFDHCTHFTTATLETSCRNAGLQVMQSASDWVAKEISLVARQADCEALAATHTRHGQAGLETLQTHLRWLAALASGAQRAAHMPGSFGIFGTSIAAAWCQHQTGGAARFFVDEDPDRVGREFMGKPILAVGSEPADGNVLLCLPDADAERVAARLNKNSRRYLRPADVMS